MSRTSRIFIALFMFTGLIFLFYRNSLPPDEANKQNSANKQNPANKQSTKMSDSDRHLYPSDWAWRQRTFPYGTADKTAHLQALKQAQSLRRSLKKRADQPVWQFAGPTNIGGRISDIEFNPQDKQIVYAGAATGGVFKSTDSGESWVPVFDDQAVLSIGDIAVDPNNPDIIYAGTGEANGGHNNFPGGGVYKSIDAGLSWELIGLETTTSIGRIVIDPVNSDRIYVAAVGNYFGKDQDRGVYRSLNGGTDWQQVLFVNDSTGAIDLIINPQNPAILFVALWQRFRPATVPAQLYGAASGIYKSLDGGDSWIRLNQDNGLPDGDNRIARIGLTICLSQPDNLYALYTNFSSNRGYSYFGLYRSTNGGDNWERTDSNNQLLSGFGNFSWYFGNVRVNPTNPETVYVLDVNLMASFDGGVNWTAPYGNSGPGNLHVDHHALAFDPTNPARILDGNDGGINISTDAGVNWTKVKSLPVTQFYQITIDPSNPEKLYGGTQDNSTVRTLTGATDDWDVIYFGDGFYVIVDPNDSNTIYAEYQFGNLAKSTNGGNNFYTVLNGINNNEPTNWSTPVVMDPNNNQVLYYGTNCIYRTVNGAASWQAISENLSNHQPGARLGTVTTIAVAQTNSAVIYAGTDDSNVWVTADSGGTWTKISTGLPYRWVTRVAVDPTDFNIAYVTFSGLKWSSPQPHVFRTTDMGGSWENISNNLPDAPVNSIIVDPDFPHILYIATDVGVYHSINSGQIWDLPGDGMPIVSVNDLAIHSASRLLAAGTHGRSMYTLDISLLNVDVAKSENTNIPASLTLLQNYPNPFNPATTIKFEISKAERVKIEIFNLIGQKVAVLVNKLMPAGSHQVEFNPQNLPGGLYLYKIKAGTYFDTKKMLYLK